MNLDCVDHARVENPRFSTGAAGMDLKEMSLEELLYFALMEKGKAA